MFLASRAALASSLVRHHSCRVFGSTAFRHPGSVCRCQKQPWTRTAFPSRGKTRSGVPGRSRRCSRNRQPSACASRRTAISGAVSVERMRAISAERRSGVIVSMRPTGAETAAGAEWCPSAADGPFLSRRRLRMATDHGRQCPTLPSRLIRLGARPWPWTARRTGGRHPGMVPPGARRARNDWIGRQIRALAGERQVPARVRDAKRRADRSRAKAQACRGARRLHRQEWRD